MQFLSFSHEHARVPASDVEKMLSTLSDSSERLGKAAEDASYSHPNSFMYTPFDATILDQAMAYASLYAKPDTVVLVGMGGSSLGVRAVMSALQDTEASTSPNMYYADTLDEDLLNELLSKVEQQLRDQKSVLVIVVSKSGKTLETVINASFFIKLLERYNQSLTKSVVVITDANSPLEDFALTHSIRVLPIPNEVGGRYSVFTSAGLFPLAVMGVDINALCRGAQSVLQKKKTADSPSLVAYESALSATLIFYHYTHGIAIHDFFTFEPELAALGAWYRQLIGESLGKHMAVPPYTPVGITPTVSVGTSDLHSVLQLYLSGPRSTYTTFVYQSQKEEAMKIPSIDGLTPSFLADKTIEKVKDAIFKGVTDAYQEQERPFSMAYFSTRCPEAVGEFLYGKMIEMVYLGSLLQVNPFNQPQVELYKKKALQILTL